MTKYFCRKCKIQMIIIEEDTDKFTYTAKCPKCRTEITVDKKEDLIS